ncbi:GNAT family N-acetyltransferase [Lysinibacillus sp. KU-BSD001]|uniref:GNAT family N-acetyltransferase n=1 Tax=Lysinibacillus sp. KU-BSD001 TaxID=3141328 RepID=UPI0036E3BF9A
MQLMKCKAHDVAQLSKLSIDTYVETYCILSTIETVQAHTAKAFTEEALLKELAHPGSTFYFALLDGEVAGYIKLNTGGAQTDDVGEDALEVERIYIQNQFQGRGLGRQLIEEAIHMARQKGKKRIWLGVWEKNEQAVAFYKKMGFTRQGEHIFMFADEACTDYIMVKEL